MDKNVEIAKKALRDLGYADINSRRHLMDCKGGCEYRYICKHCKWPYRKQYILAIFTAALLYK